MIEVNYPVSAQIKGNHRERATTWGCPYRFNEIETMLGQGERI